MSTATFLGLAMGGILGLAFAWLQLQALRRNELLERQCEIPGWMRQIPGSMGRVAFLLVGFAVAQAGFGRRIDDASMAIGVAVAYAIPFLLRLKAKFACRESA